jgi:hypothetical protein
VDERTACRSTNKVKRNGFTQEYFLVLILESVQDPGSYVDRRSSLAGFALRRQLVNVKTFNRDQPFTHECKYHFCLPMAFIFTSHKINEQKTTMSISLIVSVSGWYW